MDFPTIGNAQLLFDNEHLTYTFSYAKLLSNLQQLENSDVNVNLIENLKRLRYVIKELIESESTYVANLTDIEQGYFIKLQSRSDVDHDELNSIFYKIPELRQFHTKIYSNLLDSRDNLHILGKLFLMNTEQFVKLYVEFCANYTKAISLLDVAQTSQSTLWTLLLNYQSILGHQLTLASYLLKPVQRILKYQLLLQEFVKYLHGIVQQYSTEEHSLHYGGFGNIGDHFRIAFQTVKQALERMTKVANEINESKRHLELLDQLRALNVDVDNFGDLVLYDYFRISGKKYTLLVLLFHCAIVLCKQLNLTRSRARNSVDAVSHYNTATTHLCTSSNNRCHNHNSSHNAMDFTHSNVNCTSVEISEIINCANLMLIECIPKNPLAFHILPFDNPKAQRTLEATSLETKRHWCLEIKRLILENYDAVIPERAKQIVMNMVDKNENYSVSQKSDSLDCKRTRSTTMLDELCLHRRSETALPMISKLRSIKLNKQHSKRINTINHTLMENNPKTTTAKVQTQTIATGIFDPLTCTNLSPNNDQCFDSLFHETWNEIWAKHLSPNVTSNHRIQPHQISLESLNFSDKSSTNETDFRCIAIDVNEESFAPVKDYQPDPEDRQEHERLSLNSVHSGSSQLSRSPNQLSNTLDCNTINSKQLDSDSKNVNIKLKNTSLTNTDNSSVYIECPTASSYDLVTFGRTYEHYITKARCTVALTPNDLDEIFKPLMHLKNTGLSSDQSYCNDSSQTTTDGDYIKKDKVKDLDNDDWASAGYCSSGASSPRHLVSRIAFNRSGMKASKDFSAKTIYSAQAPRLALRSNSSNGVRISGDNLSPYSSNEKHPGSNQSEESSVSSDTARKMSTLEANKIHMMNNTSKNNLTSNVNLSTAGQIKINSKLSKQKPPAPAPPVHSTSESLNSISKLRRSEPESLYGPMINGEIPKNNFADQKAHTTHFYRSLSNHQTRSSTVRLSNYQYQSLFDLDYQKPFAPNAKQPIKPLRKFKNFQYKGNKCSRTDQTVNKKSVNEPPDRAGHVKDMVEKFQQS